MPPLPQIVLSNDKQYSKMELSISGLSAQLELVKKDVQAQQKKLRDYNDTHRTQAAAKTFADYVDQELEDKHIYLRTVSKYPNIVKDAYDTSQEEFITGLQGYGQQVDALYTKLISDLTQAGEGLKMANLDDGALAKNFSKQWHDSQTAFNTEMMELVPPGGKFLEVLRQEKQANVLGYNPGRNAARVGLCIQDSKYLYIEKADAAKLKNEQKLPYLIDFKTGSYADLTQLATDAEKKFGQTAEIK